MVTTCGGITLGGGVPTGMLRLTACNWIGIVMISMISSTSITSISGVVFISTITMGSAAGALRLRRRKWLMAVPEAQPPRAGGSVMKATLTMPARWQAYTTLPIDS